MRPRPDLDAFLALSRPGRAIPVGVEIDADTETSVSAFLELGSRSGQAFLLESVEDWLARVAPAVRARRLA